MEDFMQKAAAMQRVAPANYRPRPRVVIVGAGFGGLHAALALGNKQVDVLVVDRNNYHGFWPLLYQVATAGLEPDSIVYPVRAILHRYPTVSFKMAEVSDFDFDSNVIYADGQPLTYDYLILAAGSANNYFGKDAIEHLTYGMKDVDEAQRLRNKVLEDFEHAVGETDPACRSRLMTFVIVGGGPTGVELAGAFAELIRHVLHKDYPMLDMTESRVILAEATDHLLGDFAPNLQRNAHMQLERMGVEVMLNKAVETVEEGRVIFGDGTSVATETVVWTAGVRAAHLAEKVGVPLMRGSRVPVQPTLNLQQYPNVYVVGDMCHVDGFKPGVSHPMIAPVAIQQGQHAANNILASIRLRPLKPFRYFDKGIMATIGRRAAVMDAFGIRLTGLPAWMGWLFVHILSLIGFRNRVVVMANWVYNYFTYDRGVRLIVGRCECE